MKKSHVLLSLILCLCLNQNMTGQTIQPVERTVGKLHISIDPRLELLGAIQLLSSSQRMVDRALFYSKEIIRYFKPFLSHQAVKWTDQNPDFNSDAPVSFMLHLSQPGELEQMAELSGYVKEQGEGDGNLEQYRKAIKEFAEASNFEAFWNSQIPYYNQILDETIANMGETDFVKTLEDYFNDTQDSYNIIIIPSTMQGGGYGPKITDSNGKEHIYACISPTKSKDGIPYIDEEFLSYIVWHEFGHSFVNPLADRYNDMSRIAGSLFEPTKKRMTPWAYDNWKMATNKTILRATTIRLYDLHLSSQRSKDLSNHYIEPLVEKLKEFEKQRDENNTTFSEFYPEVVDVVHSLKKTASRPR